MDKKKLIYGVIGLLIGLASGYWATNSLNRNYANANNTNENSAANTADLPPGHPPTGATGATGATSGNSSTSGDGPQADVLAVIQQARNEPSDFCGQVKAPGPFAPIQLQDQALE